MGERSNSTSLGAIITPKSLIFFSISILFILSWFFILCSTTQNSLLSYISAPQPITHDDEQQSETEPVNENNEDITLQCNDKVPPSPQPLKVYMYDMDPSFHFGLMEWRPERNGVVWPDIKTNVPRYPGGLNMQHSVEYWLTLDLLSSEASRDSRAAVRVKNSSEADVIFVPFFSSLSYNRLSKVNQKQRKNMDKELQEKMVKYVMEQKEWKISGGRDHVIVAHHPNSMLSARHRLAPAMFILADFGRYSPRVANVQKDVIAPYKHLVKSYTNDNSDFDSRPILLYFQGAIYRKDGGFVRQELYHILKDKKDVHFEFGSVQNHGISKAGEGMRASRFCLNIAGDTPSSNRLFDAIASHCVPVIISDNIELPYEDVLNYNEFCLFVPTSQALTKGFLVNLVRGVGRDEWTRMWLRLKEVEKYFELGFPAREGDGVEMIWNAVQRKVPLMKMKVHQYQRFRRLPRNHK